MAEDIILNENDIDEKIKKIGNFMADQERKDARTVQFQQKEKAQKNTKRAAQKDHQEVQINALYAAMSTL